MTRRAVAGGLVLAALCCLALAWWHPWSSPATVSTSDPTESWDPRPSPDPAPPSEATLGSEPDAVPASGGGPVTGSAAPTRLALPTIGVGTSLVRLGLQEDGTVETPDDPDRAGWFDLGTVPGEVGSAVLLGHVDSTSGPAVFARLDELRRGDPIAVKLSDGRLERFRVRTVRTYANADFPARKVYTSHGRPMLTLVTCGGDYDPARGGWQANVVVYAEVV